MTDAARDREGRGRDALTAAGLYAGALGLYTAAASRTGLGAGELARLQMVGRAADFARQVSQGGLAAMSRASVDAVFASSATSHGVVALPVAFAGYVSALLDEHGSAFSPLLRARFGFLCLAALAVPAVFLLCRRALGPRAALLAALFLALMPRVIHEAATTTPAVLAVVGWSFVLLAYARSLRVAALFGGLTVGIAFGLALAISHSAAALLLAVPVHFAFCRGRRWLRAARAGQAELPAAFAWMLLAGLPIFVAATPSLWFDTSLRLRDLLIGALAPSVSPALYEGTTVIAPPLPASFAAHAAVLTTPTATIALAWLGLVSVAARGLANPSVDARGELGALACVGLVLTLVAPGFFPEVLTTFPPPIALASPFIAILAGLGSQPLWDLLERSLPADWKHRKTAAALGVTLMLAPPLQQSLHDWPTSAAAFAPLGGGTRGVLERRAIAPSDTSAMLPLAEAVDGLNRVEVSIYAPSLPSDTWEGLRAFGMLRTVVRAAHGAADADVVIIALADAVHAPGTLPGSAHAARGAGLGAVVRDGAALFQLVAGGAHTAHTN